MVFVGRASEAPRMKETKMAAKTKPVIDYPTTELGMLQAAIAEAKERGDHDWAAFLTGKLPNFGGTSEIPEQDALPQGDGTSNGARKPAYSNEISQKQLDLIIKLTLERTGVNLELEERAEMLAAFKKMTKKQASATIDTLFKLPKYTEVQAQVRAEGREPIPADRPTVAPVEVEADPVVLPGRYVVEGREVRISQGKKGSQWFGTIFVRDIETDRNLRGEERLAVLKAIAADPAKCAREYTQLTGRCTYCTRELINAQSIEDAMGPICSGKFGRMYGVTILGEVYVEKPKRAKKAAAAPVVTEDAPVVVQTEDRFKGFALPTVAPVAEPTAAPVRTIASGTAAKKAQKVMDALQNVGENGSLAVSGETTTLTATVKGAALQVTWDGVSFRYGADSTLGGKKYRNVSELLRLIG